MEVLPSRKNEWVLTAEAFEQLLGLLDEDRERAGAKYELVRRKLVELFEARGSQSPADHADETINRAARKIVEGEQVLDINKYLYGVARLLLLELGRAREKIPLSLDTVAPPSAQSVEERQYEEQLRGERERRFECFEQCLNTLTPESRVFIIDYYREEKGAKIKERKRQAEALGLSPNALRLRAARLRASLERCLGECLKPQSEK